MLPVVLLYEFSVNFWLGNVGRGATNVRGISVAVNSKRLVQFEKICLTIFARESVWE